MLTGEQKPNCRSFISRFEEMAYRHPDRSAVMAGDRCVTYRQLRARALVCAERLARLPAGCEAALLGLPRRVELIAAMIACQYCGVPYVPIDFRMPAQRLRQVLDAFPTCAAVQDTRLGVHPGVVGAHTVIDMSDDATVDTGSMPMSAPTVQETHEIYRIFTSGSTGIPKMVRVTTRGCANLLEFFGELLLRDVEISQATVLSSTSPGFDIFFLEYALPLANGGLLMLASENDASSPQALAQWLGKMRPTVYQTTPSLLKCLLPYLPASFRFDRLLVGGESLGQPLSVQIHARSAHAFNVYGPTETTVWSACQRIADPGEQRIGLPICNTEIEVVDESGRTAFPGVHGRILIGGHGVALGYAGDPVLSAAKFIVRGSRGRVFYDTGDIGFIDEEGRLNFVARADDFVKINGHRVDPLEISDALESLLFVAEAAVVHVIDRYGVDSLTAFIKLDPRHVCADPVQQARAHMERSLPAYMKPRWLEVVHEFPRNSAGKLDRKALAATYMERAAAVELSMLSGQDARCDDGPERLIVALLRPYVDVARLGPNDNLFQRGLTSMHAVSFHLALSGRWPHIELFHVFEFPTLSGLSRLVLETV